MLKLVFIFIIFVMFNFYCFAGDNVCKVENLESYNSDHYSVTVSLTNSDTLAGFQIPLYFDFDQSSLIIDSVSFNESRCIDFAVLDSKIDTSTSNVLVASIFDVSGTDYYSPLFPGYGNIAKIYFTVIENSSNNKLKIKLSHYQYDNNKIGYSFWSPDAVEIRCRFETQPLQIIE